MELFIKRAFAFIIDALIVGIPSSMVSLIFLIIRGILSYIPILNILSRFIWVSMIGFVFFLVYEVGCMILFGNTLGKKLVGLRVLGMKKKGKVDLWSVLLRSFVKVASFSGPFSFLLIINVLIMILRDEHKSLHDYVSESSVWEI